MLQPIGDHILVKPLSKEEITKGGIVLPEVAKEKPQSGEVIAVGQGKYMDGKLLSFKELGVEVGQTVMFSKYGPTEIKIDDEEYYILESHDILGVVSKSKK
jgi:chaperonin GroES